MRTLFKLLVVIGFFGETNCVNAMQQDVRLSTLEEIRQEAVRSELDPIGHALPLVGHWNTGALPNGFSPDYQLRMIEAGHYLLPWFQMPYPGKEFNSTYYMQSIKKIAELGLPISFVSTQWERLLSEEDSYLNLPEWQNPNVVSFLGVTLKKVSPFGPEELWYQVGRQWMSNKIMAAIESWYPSPPLVLFISNNEHSRLSWTEAEIDNRYIEQYGLGKDSDFKRKIIGDKWIKLYRSMIFGMRDSLRPEWSSRAKFIGYSALQTWSFGLQSDWDRYSLHTLGRNSPCPLAWDGASMPYYMFNFEKTLNDYTVYSPQLYAMNWLFMLDEARKASPEFWFEISTWDGHDSKNDKRQMLSKTGAGYDPIRYGGLVQFGAWLTRPRLVREFRHWNAELKDEEAYFDAVVSVVDRVHNNPILRHFWRKGELIPNPARQHPLQASIPISYQSINRWYLLNTSIDPASPWSLATEVPVYSIAIVDGKSPNREWLVYAFSPLAEYSNVKVTIPGYRDVSITASPAGVFNIVYESSGKSHILKPDEQLSSLN